MYTVIVLILLVLSIFFLYKSIKWKKESIKEKTIKEEISTLLENLNDGLIEYDGEMKVLRLNKRAELILGIVASDTVGIIIKPNDAPNLKIGNLAKVSYPAFGSKVKHDIENITGKKTNNIITLDTYDVIINTLAEKKIRVFTAAKVEDRSNEPIGFIKVIRDITKEDLISHSKSDLIAVVAHQLRAPLSAIRWILGSLSDQDYGPVNEKQKELLAKGTATTADLVSLVDEILDLAKIEEARFDYNFETVDVASMVSGIIESLKEKAEKRKVNLLSDLPKEKIEATFDAGRMKMVFTNIIDNAINYSKEGGSVEIKVYDKGDDVVLDVKDSGIGIPEDATARMFEKFYRANNARQTKPQGTGLGLFLSKTIVEGHGGKISYKSKENEGTEFMLAFPKKPKIKTYGTKEKNDKVYGI